MSENKNRNENIKIFKECLKKQCILHSTMQPQDVVKLCFQAAYGAEHLLTNVDAARDFFEKEYEGTESVAGPLYEQLSGQVFRVNLAAWKQREFPKEWLFGMFAATAGRISAIAGSTNVGKVNVTPKKDGSNIDGMTGKNKKVLFEEYLKAAEEMLFVEDNCNFTWEEWRRYLADYCSKEPEAVHHSEIYRAKEHPAYRIVRGEYIRLLPILEKICEMRKQRPQKSPGNAAPFVIAIDGRAAAGKTTLAAALQLILQASVIHMDDFFLPMELRSKERFLEPGGNVHYERFREEVLSFLRSDRKFSYRKFDCSCMDFNGEIQVEAGEWRIVEGSYSLHPVFGEYADLKIFCDVAPDEQMRRIEKRNGTRMAEMFRTRWIPLEEAYFEACSIKEKAGYVMET